MDLKNSDTRSFAQYRIKKNKKLTPQRCENDVA